MIPLAERMRPTSISNYIGQEHILGPDQNLSKAIEQKNLHSFILWGPPGVGKTSLANLIAHQLDLPFYSLSAINSGVKDIRQTIALSKKVLDEQNISPILFIDEIHRFSKSQQDALLGAVEKGIVTLIGATTENPSFEVISALLSRCQVYILESLSSDALRQIVDQAIEQDNLLQKLDIDIKEYDALFYFSGGDARKLLNALELVVNDQARSTKIVIDNQTVEKVITTKIARFDKSGEQHYDTISAFIKSVRGSDPQAAVYWLARMIAGGEDPKFISRRLIILAAEDIGLANPNALLLANQGMQAVQAIGFPEARIILSEVTIYLATSPKSNSAYQAIGRAQKMVEQTGDLPVPLHLRNAPTTLMKDIGYGANYQYAHDYQEHFVQQEYLPDRISGKSFYHPAQNPHENKIKDGLVKNWKNKYKL